MDSNQINSVDITSAAGAATTLIDFIGQLRETVKLTKGKFDDACASYRKFSGAMSTYMFGLKGDKKAMFGSKHTAERKLIEIIKWAQTESQNIQSVPRQCITADICLFLDRLGSSKPYHEIILALRKEAAIQVKTIRIYENDLDDLSYHYGYLVQKFAEIYIGSNDATDGEAKPKARTGWEKRRMHYRLLSDKNSSGYDFLKSGVEDYVGSVAALDFDDDTWEKTLSGLGV